MEYSLSFTRLFDAAYLRATLSEAFQDVARVQYVTSQWKTYLADYQIDDNWLIQGESQGFVDFRHSKLIDSA